jgi:hypothetical protein
LKENKVKKLKMEKRVKINKRNQKEKEYDLNLIGIKQRSHLRAKSLNYLHIHFRNQTKKLISSN